MPANDYMLCLRSGQAVYNAVDKLGENSVKAASIMACGGCTDFGRFDRNLAWPIRTGNRTIDAVKNTTYLNVLNLILAEQPIAMCGNTDTNNDYLFRHSSGFS